MVERSIWRFIYRFGIVGAYYSSGWLTLWFVKASDRFVGVKMFTFDSPEPVVRRPSVCPYVHFSRVYNYLFIHNHVLDQSISTKLGTEHPLVKEFQVCSNEGPRPFPRRDITTKHRKNCHWQILTEIKKSSLPEPIANFNLNLTQTIKADPAPAHPPFEIFKGLFLKNLTA